MNKTTDEGRIVEVYNGSRWEAELIKGLLESSWIMAEVKDGLMSSFAPYISPTVSVMVKEYHDDDASELIKTRHSPDLVYQHNKVTNLLIKY